MRNRFKQILVNTLWHLPFSFYANIRYGFPSRGFKIIGVTGTDGKTTTVSMIYHILNSKKKVGMISTISARVDGDDLDIGLHVTTPAHPSFADFVRTFFRLEFRKLLDMKFNPESIHKYLRYLKSKQVEFVIIETTSQGLDQYRLYGIEFDEAVYTNIGSDHLDYHGDWESYAHAKARLINLLKPTGRAIINADDKSASLLKKVAGLSNASKVLYSKDDISDYSYSNEGLNFVYKDQEFSIPIIGEYNLENLLAAINACSQYLSLEEISGSLNGFSTPKGRMEIMQTAPFMVVVDFAHTPGALDRALDSITKLKTNDKQKVITVFGCAGKRDKSRRDMGIVSYTKSDITILTAEDPRDEKLEDINRDIVDRIEKHIDPDNSSFRLVTIRLGRDRNLSISKVDVHSDFQNFDYKNLNLQEGSFFSFNENSIQSRKDAISFALQIAKPGDIVYITGKGHEQSLAFGPEEKEISWSDQEYIKTIIK